MKEIWLIYNLVLISAVQPSGSVLYTFINIYMHIHIYVYIYTHTHTYIYMYIYIYTHTLSSIFFPLCFTSGY